MAQQSDFPMRQSAKFGPPKMPPDLVRLQHQAVKAASRLEEVLDDPTISDFMWQQLSEEADEAWRVVQLYMDRHGDDEAMYGQY